MSEERKQEYADAIAEVEAKHMFYSHSRPGFRMFGCTGCGERFPDHEGHPKHVAALRLEAILALADAEIEAATKVLRSDAETRRLAYVSERDLRREIEAERDALRAIIREQDEPEYEYRLRVHGVVTASRFDTLEDAQEWGRPIHHNKVIIRRRKAGEWEVVE